MHAGFAQQAGHLHELAAFLGRRGIDGDQRLAMLAVSSQPEIAPETGIGGSGDKRGKIQPIPLGEGLRASHEAG